MISSLRLSAFLLLVASGHSYETQLKITVTNIAYQQPFGPFFVAVHDETADPVFRLGMMGKPELGFLAENGSPAQLIDFYSTNTQGISSATGEGMGVFFAGETRSFEVTVSEDYPYVSFASMAVNTNDCFGGVDSAKLYGGETLYSPGYDSGTEENNELCSSVPGPACPMDSGNAADGNGEGVVHIHRGVHGIANLTASVYDWRNPMLKIQVDKCEDLSFMAYLWNADTDMPIRKIYKKDMIDMCMYEGMSLTVAAVPPCAVNAVVLALYYKGGGLIVKNTEGNSPYTLGDDIDGEPVDVLPVPELTMEGEYLLKVGEPGMVDTKFYLKVKACDY